MVSVMVTGGRAYGNAVHVGDVLDRLHRDYGIAEVIHGACGGDADDPKSLVVDRMRGADFLADVWARKNRIRATRVLAHWSVGGRGGPIRNEAMIALAPDIVVAFPGGDGTDGAVKLALQAGIRVLDMRGEPTIPPRIP